MSELAQTLVAATLVLIATAISLGAVGGSCVSRPRRVVLVAADPGAMVGNSGLSALTTMH
ncbi:MAG: hypothetical protein ABI442_11980 [Gemmatimonadaceae bacterium]